MVNPFLASPIDYIIDSLVQYVFGSYPFFAGYLIILALVVGVKNGFNKELTIYVMSPMLVSLIVASFLPQVFWLVLIIFSTALWALFFFKIGNISR